MNAREDELQRHIERGNVDEANVDAKAYQRVFNALTKKPNYYLHPSFADRVIEKVLVQQKQNESVRDHWWLALGIFILVIVLIVSIVVAFASIDVHVNLGFLKGMDAYKGLFFVGAALILLFNRLEKRLWKRKFEV